MAKYSVTVWSKADVSTTVSVETDTEKQARIKAEEAAFQNGDLEWKWEGLTEDVEAVSVDPA